MTGEAEHATAVLQRNDQVPCVAARGSNLAPCHAHVHRAAEFQPAAGQEEMAEPIGAPATEANRRYEVTGIAGRQWLETVGDRELTLFELAPDVARVETR